MSEYVNYMAMPGVPRSTNRDRSKLFNVFNPEIIIKTTCEYFNKPLEVLQGGCRKRELVMPRHIIMYFLAEYTDMTYLVIAKIFNRHHTMVIYSMKTIRNLMTTDDNTKAHIDNLKKLIANNH